MNKNKKSVLYVIGSLAVGGAEKHLSRVAVELKKRGLEVGIFAIDPNGPLKETLINAGVNVYGWEMSEACKKLISIKKLRTMIKLFMSFITLVKISNKIKPKAMHFFLPEAYILGGIASFFYGSPIRIMSRRSMNDYQKKHKILTMLERLLHSHMDAVCGNSAAVVRQLEGEGIDKSKLHLTYNGVDVSLFGEAQKQKRRQLTMVMVANLIPYKGHEDLIRALSIANNRLPRNWRMLFVGRNDGIQGNLETMAQELGVGEHIEFMGPRMDIPDLLQSSDIGILSSHQEGFSNAVLEGMAAGLPMVVTDVGGNAEAVIDGENGFVVPPHSPEQLAEAICKLLSEDIRKKMGDASRARVREVFSIDASIDGYEKLYF